MFKLLFYFWVNYPAKLQFVFEFIFSLQLRSLLNTKFWLHPIHKNICPNTSPLSPCLLSQEAWSSRLVPQPDVRGALAPAQGLASTLSPAQPHSRHSAALTESPPSRLRDSASLSQCVGGAEGAGEVVPWRLSNTGWAVLGQQQAWNCATQHTSLQKAPATASRSQPHKVCTLKLCSET